MREQGDPQRAIMVIFEANLMPEQWSRLLREFDVRIQTPVDLIESYLTQDPADPMHWQMITVWRNRQAFNVYRAGAAPAEQVAFRSLGAEPRVSIFEIARSLHNAPRALKD
jgi:hypothetical protein